MAAVVGAAGLATAGAVVLGPIDRADALDPDFKAEVVHFYEGSTGFGDLSSCGPRNINGRGDGNAATWRVLSTLEPGKSVEVNTQWIVRASVTGLTANAGNNGPDPLKLRLDVAGPAAGVDIVGVSDPGPGEVLHGGDGFTGSVGPLSPLSWEFDANSNPGVFESGDGADVQMDVTLQAAAEGVVTMPRMVVSGYDGTPVAGNFSCNFNLNWSWTVHNIDLPTSGTDHALTDSSYGFDTVDDRNGGAHGISIPVLKNDNDPEVPGGPGNPAEVRVRDWTPLSVRGGTVVCAGTKNAATFANMSVGPCTYTPPQDLAIGTNDSFQYLLRSVSGKQRFITVTIDLRDNTPPIGGAEEFNVLVNTPGNFQLEPFDPQGDDVSCVSDPFLAQPNGSGLLNADCSFSWDANVAPGDKTFTYRTCDSHDLLQNGDLGSIGGSAVSRAAGYHLGSPNDIDPDLSSRCRDAQATVSVFAGVQLPPTGGTDNDTVDSGYSGDGVGPYTLNIPVRANDIDLNGVDPSDPTWNGTIGIFTGPDPTEGAASVNADDEVVFTPADGFEGLVQFTYLVCEDPLQQVPPKVDDPQTLPNEGLGLCGSGTVNVLVVGNDPPVATNDEDVVANDDHIVDLDLSANDSDPEGQTLECIAGDLVAAPAGLIDSANVDAQCLADINPLPGVTGVVTMDYTICDVHALLHPAFPADPYGADGRAPGDLANRCTTATLSIEIVDPLAVPPDDANPDPDPTCVDDTATTTEDEQIVIDVLENDSDTDLQDNASPLTVDAAGIIGQNGVSDEGGAVTPTGDGTGVRYVPADGFVGVDTFLYAALDAEGQACNASVTVTVNGALGGVANTGPSDAARHARLGALLLLLGGGAAYAGRARYRRAH